MLMAVDHVRARRACSWCQSAEPRRARPAHGPQRRLPVRPEVAVMTTPAQPGPVIAHGRGRADTARLTAPRGGAAERGPQRAMARTDPVVLVVATIGLLLVAAPLLGARPGAGSSGSSSDCWPGPSPLAPATSGSRRRAWPSLSALDGMLGLTDRGPFWVLGAVIGVIGVGLRLHRRDRTRPDRGTDGWARARPGAPLSRPARLGARRSQPARSLVVLLAYTTYVGVVGSDAFVHESNVTDCRTPMQRYGWRLRGHRLRPRRRRSPRRPRTRISLQLPLTRERRPEMMSSRVTVSTSPAGTSPRTNGARANRSDGPRSCRAGSRTRARSSSTPSPSTTITTWSCMDLRNQGRSSVRRDDARSSRAVGRRGDGRLGDPDEAACLDRRNGQLDGRRHDPCGGRPGILASGP